MRDSYIFYASFYEAIKELDDADRLVIYDAINAYSLGGEVPELRGISKALFTLMRPQLDANQRRYDNGTKGGRPPKNGNQEGSKNKPIGNQTETNEEPNGNQEGSKPKANYNDNYNDNVNQNGNNNLNQNPLSSESGITKREDLEILEIFFFEKRFINPHAELNRFYAHYSATDWLNANGIKIINRASAAKGWTNKETTLHNEEFVKNWQKIYTGLARDGDTIGERKMFLTDVSGMAKDSNGRVKISCTPTLIKLLEAKIQILKPLLISLYGEIQGLKYTKK